MIYLINFGTCYKIGKTNNLYKRLQTFKTAREKVELVSIIAFKDNIVVQEFLDQKGENYLHSKLKEYQISNELFQKCPEVLNFFLNYKYEIVKDYINWVEVYTSYINSTFQKQPNLTIFQYDLQGNFIQKHENMTEAQKATGISVKNISKVCNGDRRQSGNFIWSKHKLSEQEIKEKISKIKKNRKIVQMDLDNNFIAVYDSLTEASKDTGINISCISNNIAGRVSRAGHFRWKYQ